MADAEVIFNGLDDAELIALAKAGGKATANLTPGDYPFNFTVKVAGTIRKGAPSEYTPTVSIPYKEVFALFVKYSGVTGPHALKAMRIAMKKALRENSKPDFGLMKEAEKQVKASLAAMPKQTKVGLTTLVGDLVVEKINKPVEVHQAA